ncbi:MAG: hypothetical protein Q9208_004785 [Pyrenodesmia sp. 3 TL-2023]
MPSLNYVNNWQFCLVFSSPWDKDVVRNARWIREELLSAASRISSIPNLQTLKIFVPCLCKTYTAIALTQRYKAIISSLTPLQQLRFQSVRVIAFLLPDRILNNSGEFSGFSHQYGEILCTKPACVAFARSFSSMKEVLQGNTPPTLLTSRESAWLDLKAYASLVPPPSTKPVRCALYDLWKLVDVKTEGPFYKELQVTKKIINDELKAQYQKGRYQRNEVVRYSGSWWRQTPLEDLAGVLSLTGGANPSTGPRPRAECQRWGRRP